MPIPPEARTSWTFPALGITEDTFAGGIIIADLGSDMQVTIDSNTIALVRVNGVGANTITMQDFLLSL